jgi:hypothetical protein
MPTANSNRPPLEDVLDAFSMEPDTDQATLERYLRDYPEYADALIDLSRELSRVILDNEQPLSPEEVALIDAAWRRHQDAEPKAVVDPFSALSTAEQRQLAASLAVPRQVIAAFKERRVVVGSIPKRFLDHLAAALNCARDTLIGALAPQPAQEFARSYKADVKPDSKAAVTFEQLLVDAGVPTEKRAQLLADD